MPQGRALALRVVRRVPPLQDRPEGPLVVVPEQAAREVQQELVVPQVQALHLVRQPQELQARSRVQYRQWALRLRVPALLE